MINVLTNEILANLWEEYFSNKCHYDAINHKHPFWVEYVDYNGELTCDSWTAKTLEEEYARGTIFTFVALVIDPTASAREDFFYMGK